MWDGLFCHGCGLIFDCVGVYNLSKAYRYFKGTLGLEGMGFEGSEESLQMRHAVLGVAYVSLGCGWHALGFWSIYQKIEKERQDAKLRDKVRDYQRNRSNK